MRTDDNGHWQIWTANPDLTAQHLLTGGDHDNGWATWSPDGTRLAFDSARLAPEANGDLKEIFTMAPDGSDVRQVTDLGFYSGQPTWSRDGRWIAFTTDGGNYPATQGIYVVHPDGTGLRQVAALPPGRRSVWLDAPRFSPDGPARLHALPGWKQTPPRGAGRARCPRSGWSTSTERPSHGVNPGHKVGDADWSPDGRFLVFEQVANDPGTITSVLRVPASGGGIKALTHDAGYLGGRSGSWSSRRASTLCTPQTAPRSCSRTTTYSPDFGCTGLQVMDADGTDQRWVDVECGVEHQVDWGTSPLELLVSRAGPASDGAARRLQQWRTGR